MSMRGFGLCFRDPQSCSKLQLDSIRVVASEKTAEAMASSSNTKMEE